MKKYIIALALAVVVFAVSAAETALLKYAPDSSVGVSEIDVAAFMKHPTVLQMLNKPECKASREEWEAKSGVRLADLKKIAFFIGADGNVFSCIAVDKNLAVEKIFKQNKVAYRQVAVGNRKVYRLAGGKGQKQSADVAELAPGVIIVGSKGQLAGYFKQKCGELEEIAAMIEQIPDVPFWLAFVNRFKNPSGTVEDPRKVFCSFNFSGKEQKDLELKISAVCGSAEGAQMMAGAIPMYTMMGLALVFSADPELSGQIAACVKPVAKDCTVTIFIRIKAELAEKIVTYLEQNADTLSKKFGGKKSRSPRQKRKTPAVAPME